MFLVVCGVCVFDDVRAAGACLLDLARRFAEVGLEKACATDLALLLAGLAL
jgi:hypothetical protein